MAQVRVLIVDDEENERNGLAELIASWGYQTQTAADGVEALQKVDAWSPAIVITDLKMPRMNGTELVQRLSEHPLPVQAIVITAQGSVDSAVEAMKLGASDYIEKPIY